MLRRLDKLPEDPGRDAARMAQVHQVREAYDKLLARQPKDRPMNTAVADIRWMIEEFRVSLFAQQLGTAYAVSAQRIEKAIRAAA
jgi:ATP-dependent helicase HrpA